MSKKRKISIRRILQVFVTLVVSSGCIVAILSASGIEDAKKLNGIDIRISDENKCHFLDKNELLATITQDKNIENLSASRLDIGAMENVMLANPWIGDAQVYIDNNRTMHVSINQRLPVVRVFEANGTSYYLDTTLKAVPLSDRFVYYSLAVTNVPHLGDDSSSRSLKAQIVMLVKCIEEDTFWSVMTSQVMIDSVYGFQILPVLGNQTIMLGDTSRLKEKLNNVFLFYKKILNNIGWDKYEVLDARFKGQLVASPALPWKAPGKTVTNMDWVKTIMEQGEKKEEQDSATKKVTNAFGIKKSPILKAHATTAKLPATKKLINEKPQGNVNHSNKENKKPNKPNNEKRNNHSPNKSIAI